VVLADPEHVESDVIGVLDLVQEIAQAIRRAAHFRLAHRRCEAVNADLHGTPNSYASRSIPGAISWRPAARTRAA